MSAPDDSRFIGEQLATALQKAADALMAAAVNHHCPRAREAAREADALLEKLGYPHPDPMDTQP